MTMRNVRILNSGQIDLTGQRVNSLRVEAITSRTPFRYAVKCEICDARTTEPHQRLISGAATCRSSVCGKSTQPKGRDILSEHRERLAELENERLAESRRASEDRMQAEVLELPTEQRRLEAERAEAERKLAAQRAQNEASENARKDARRRYDASWILTDPDPNIFVSDAMRNARMPAAQVDAHNEKEVNSFVGSTPEYLPYKSPENANKILQYFERNGVHIYDAAMLKAAFVRLRNLGVLELKPAVASQPANYTMRPKANLRIAGPVPETSGPVVYEGWDVNGEPCVYSEREVSRWSSDEMKKRLRLTTASGALSLPNVGPGPKGTQR